MRKTLVAAVALAPLCLALGLSPAQATDTVSNGVSTPIATATATNGAADDINITGSVTVTGTTAAVTQNSANAVTNSGTISITGTTDATTVLLQGGAGTTTGQTAFVNTGTITNSVNYSPSDSLNSDGIYEAPFAGTTTNTHYGVLVNGLGTGAISNAGTISIQGNNSYGVSIEAPVYGAFTNSGTIGLTGDNSVGVRSTAGGTINGNVIFTGAVTATGKNTSAVNLAGAVNGNVGVYSSITATGYSTTTRPTSDSELANIEGSTSKPGGTPTDTEQSAAAMIVSGNVSHGILIGAPPVGTTTTSTGDVDADGIADNAEGTGAVNVYGSAPALQVGASGATTVIGNVGDASGATDTEGVNGVPGQATANNYGLIVRGSINAFGTFDGVTATALQIGASDGTGTVNMTGGVRVTGSITAQSYDADASAIHITSGSTVAELRNEGFIESTVLHSTVVVPNVTTATGGVNAATSYGVIVDKGGSLATLTNYGYLTASATGDNANASAIVDKSTGAVGGNTILNEGIISSAITAGVTGDAITGKTIAADYSANTTGVTLIQQANTTPISIEVETTTTSSGTTSTTGATTGTVAGSTVDTTSVTTTTTSSVTTTASGVTTTTTSTTPTVPAIVGDVLLGSGTNVVQLHAGSMTGALDLGSGTGSSLIIDNTSNVTGALTTYAGALTYEGTGGVIKVNDGVLVDTSPTTIKLSTFNVGSTGTVYFAVDPAKGAATEFVVNGSATLAQGATLGIDALSAVGTPQTYTLISATSLTNNTASDSVLLSQVPYLLNATATTNAAAGTISVTVSDKTASQLGLNPGETAAFTPLIASLGNDTAIQSELLGQYDKGSFLGVYDQLLPDYAGGVFQLASAASDAITRATSRTNDIENPAGTRGAWGQEFAFGIDRSRGSTPGYQGSGFGFLGGLETGGAGLGAFGVTAAFAAGSIRDPHSPGDNQQSLSEGELGAYWQGQFGNFRADARVGGGYLNFSDRRELQEVDSTGTITLDRQAKAGSQGWSATGHFGAAYQFNFGKFYVRPQSSADYYRLFEGGYTEHGGESASGGDGFDLAVESRTGYQSSATAAIVTGTTFGGGFLFRPELELGYRDVFSGTAGDTTAHFLQTGAANFTLLPAQITGGGPEVRFGLKGDTDFYELDFQVGGEERNSFYEADVKFNVRILF